MNNNDITEPITEFATNECPPATQNIALNLKNRKNAIDVAMYGPLNPAEANDEYWQAIAAEWNVDVETAKKQRCGNCAVFVITTEMKKCISQGLTGKDESNEFDAIDSAGELGYCEAFDFKCASARTCRAWVSGGPIDDSSKDPITSSAYEGGDGDITIVDDIFVEEPFEGDINDLIAISIKDIMEVAEEDPNADSYEESEMEDL